MGIASVTPLMSDNETKQRDLNRSICLLTYLLGSYRPTESHPRLQNDKVTKSDKALADIVTLLTTAQPASSDPKEFRDIYGNTVVAATFSIYADGIEAFVTQNVLPSSQIVSPPALRLLSDPSIPLAETASNIFLRNERGYDKHFEDVCQAVNLCRQIPREDFEPIWHTEKIFLSYVMSHAYRKMLVRMHLGGKLFAKHPIGAIEAYFQNPGQFNPKRKFPWALETTNHHGNFLRMIGVHADRSGNGSKIYVIDGNNIKAYVEHLLTLYNGILAIISNEGRGKTTQEKLDKDNMDSLLKLLFSFHGFLSLGLVENLLSDSALLDIIFGTSDQDVGQVNVTVSGLGGGTQTATSANDDDPNIDLREEKAELGLLPDETREGQIIRYLKRIIAWVPACERISHNHHKLPSPLTANLISFPSPSINKDDLNLVLPFVCSLVIPVYEALAPPRYTQAKSSDESGSDTSNSSGEPESASYIVNKEITEKLEKIKTKPGWTGLPVLHAEASLMGLAFATQITKEHLIPSAIQKCERVFQSDVINIGVSKRCCWCCWRLSQLLTEGTKDFQIRLPGSHSTIFPWYPPMGVPVLVLEQLRDELVKIYAENLHNRRKRTPSHQSSIDSASDVDSMPDESNIEDHKVNLDLTAWLLSINVTTSHR